MIAALDTSNGIAFTIADKNGDKIASIFVPGARGTLTTLPNIVNQILCDNGFSLKDINKWVLGTGPGSFTGIRIGLAFAKGICLASGTPFTGLSTSYALAAMAVKENTNAKFIAVLYDGRKSELLYHIFENYDGVLTPLKTAEVITPDDLTTLSPMPDTFITMHHDAVNKILSKTAQAKTIYCDSIDAFHLIKPAKWDVSDTLEEMIKSCEPVYVRPAVFTTPKPIRTVY